MVYLQITYELCFGKRIFNILYRDFSRGNTNIEAYRCIRVYASLGRPY